MGAFYSKINLLIILVILSCSKLLAIIVPIPLEERIQHSTQIVLATLVEQQSYWDIGKKNIYTSNLFEITAYLKQGTTKSYIQMITLGGVIGADAQTVFPAIQLEIGVAYCLLLEAPIEKQLPLEVASARTAATAYFQPVAYMQGVLPLKDGKYIDSFSKTNWTETNLVNTIKRQVQFSPVTPVGTTFSPRTNGIVQQSLSRSGLILSNGSGEPTSTFYAGTIDTDKEMIISGSGFGNQVGFLQFTNSNTGGIDMGLITYETDIVYWNDGEIRAKIPSFAGTGVVEVKNATGNIVGRADIIIEWSLNPVYSTYRGFEKHTRQQAKLLNVNEEGGYTILLNTTSGFAGDAKAVEAFERALNTWQCETKVNWELDKSGVTTGIAKDDLCVIAYSTSLPQGVLGLATTRYKALGNSRCNEMNTLWSVKEFDIELMPESHLFKGYGWNFSTEQPTAFQFDFESIVLHELGHAHGLGHVINEEHVMHFAIANGQSRRNISTKEAECGIHKIAYSLEDNCITSGSPMQPYPNDCDAAQSGSITTITTAPIKLLIEGFYDIHSADMHTALATGQLLPSSQPFVDPPFNYHGTEQLGANIEDIVDWVFVQLRDANDKDVVIHQKAALLRKDGFLVNENGEEVIDFGVSHQASYYIAVFHKSHLPVLSSKPHLFTANNTSTTCDFTVSEASAMGADQLKNMQGKFALNAGDFDNNGIINNQDFNIWKQYGAAVNSYLSADADGNGIINNQDYNLWKANRSKVSILLE